MIDHTKFRGKVNYKEFKVEDVFYKEGVDYSDALGEARRIKETEKPASEMWAELFYQMAICEGAHTAEEQKEVWNKLCTALDIGPYDTGFHLREV